MEVNEENLRVLSNYLLQTLDPNPAVRRPSEKFLESVEGNRNYAILLLNLINNQNIDRTVKIAGSDEDKEDKICSEDREAVKSIVIDTMLTAEPSIQNQISDAINIIGKSDFPKKWPNLITYMVEKFGTGDFHIINGILHTAHSIFKRYRYEFKSQALWEEIKFVLDTFAKPLTDLFQATMELAKTHADNPMALGVVYSSLLLVLKIFYSLNFQDLPEFFEDNMQIWMTSMDALLTADPKSLATSSDSEPGPVENLKSQICFNVSLYAQKYDEEFRPYLPAFVKNIWNLLVSTGLQTKYDLLVSNALQFLSKVAERDQYSHLFQDDNVLSSICEKVIIPNVHFREMDQELFEDNPDEYIRRDIEGADIETRRRAACDLVKVLAVHFDERVSKIFSQYVQLMLTEYTNSPETNWRQKDTALYIVTCLAERGSTARHGVTKTCSMVSLPDFAKNTIIPELEKDANILPVIKADCIKYLIKFRSVLPGDLLVATMPYLIRHLSANTQVVHSYASCAIEKIMTVRSNNKLLVDEQKLAPLTNDLLKGLIGVFSKPGSEENEFAMKALMRSFSTLQQAVIPYLSELLPVLTEKLTSVTKNPKKPHFNHYLFETLSLSIRIVCTNNPESVAAFESAFFPIFQIVLQSDVQEFIPYVMQILSQMLELRPMVCGPYLELYPCLLTPELWERVGNVKGLVKLLKAYVKKADRKMFDEHIKITGLLGVFQKLISTKANDHEGYNLIQCMMAHCDQDLLEPFIKQIFMLLFQRLMSSKTTKFIRYTVVFFCFFCLKYGPDTFISTVDSIQPKMFSMIVERLFIPDAQKIDGTDRRTAILGISKLLAESKQLREGEYSQLWIIMMKVLTDLIDLPVDESVNPDDFYVDVDTISSYDGTYNELMFVGKNEDDILKGLINVNSLSVISDNLNQHQKNVLASLCTT